MYRIGVHRSDVYLLVLSYQSYAICSYHPRSLLGVLRPFIDPSSLFFVLTCTAQHVGFRIPHSRSNIPLPGVVLHARRTRRNCIQYTGDPGAR